MENNDTFRLKELLSHLNTAPSEACVHNDDIEFFTDLPRIINIFHLILCGGSKLPTRRWN
jgi:hypothetical protein